MGVQDTIQTVLTQDMKILVEDVPMTKLMKVDVRMTKLMKVDVLVQRRKTIHTEATEDQERQAEKRKGIQ